MRVLTRVCDEFEVHVSPSEFFAAATVAGQAHVVETARSSVGLSNDIQPRIGAGAT
jgi:hypothetical protein